MVKSQFTKAVKKFEKELNCKGFLTGCVKLETFTGNFRGEECSHYIPSERVLRVNTQAWDVTSELVHEASHAVAFQTFKSEVEFKQFMTPFYSALLEDTKMKNFLSNYNEEDHMDEAFAEGIAQAFKNPKWELGQKLVRATRDHMSRC